jgi:hypothetical protein
MTTEQCEEKKNKTIYFALLPFASGIEEPVAAEGCISDGMPPLIFDRNGYFESCSVTHKANQTMQHSKYQREREREAAPTSDCKDIGPSLGGGGAGPYTKGRAAAAPAPGAVVGAGKRDSSEASAALAACKRAN